MATELSTLMIKIDTADAARANGVLESLAAVANSTGVEGTRLGKAYDEAAKGLSRSANAMTEAFRATVSPLEAQSAAIQQQIDDFRKYGAEVEAAKAVERQLADAGEAKKAFEEKSKAIRDEIAVMKENGAAVSELAAKQAELKGFRDQISGIKESQKAYMAQIAAMKESGKATELIAQKEKELTAITAKVASEQDKYSTSMRNITKAAEDGKRLMEEYQSPLEKYKRKIEEISAAEKQGAIDKQTYAAAIRATKKELDESQKHFGLFEMSSKAAFAAMGAAAVAAAAIVVRELLKTASAMDEVMKTSQKIGVSAQGLVQLRYAAELSGVSAEALSSSLNLLNKNIATSEKDFAKLGISVRDASGNLRNADSVLYDIADKFAEVDDGSGKSAAAMELLGRGGAQLVPLLNAGAKGLEEMADEASRLGIVFTDEAGRAAEMFNDNLTRLKKVKEGIVTQVTTEMLPAMVGLSDSLAAAAMDAEFMGSATSDLSKIMEGATIIGSALFGALKTLADVLSTALATAIQVVVVGFQNMYNAMMIVADPIVKLFKEGPIAAFNELKSRSRAAVDDVILGAKSIGTQWSDTGKGIAATWGGVAKMIDAAANPDLSKLQGAAAKTGDALDKMGDSAKAAADAFKKLQDEGKALAESLMTYSEKEAAEYKKLDKMLKKRVITQETYDRAIIKSVEAHMTASEKILSALDSQTEAEKRAHRERTKLYEEAATNDLITDEKRSALIEKSRLDLVNKIKEIEKSEFDKSQKLEEERDKYFNIIKSEEEIALASYNRRSAAFEFYLSQQDNKDEEASKKVRDRMLADYQKEDEMIKAQREAKRDKYLDYLKTEEELEQASLERRSKEIMGVAILKEQEKNDIIAKMQEEHNKKMSAIHIKNIQTTMAAYASFTSGMTSMLGAAFGEQFGLTKAFGIATATINTATALASALATQPFIPAGIAAWGTALGATAGLISQIKGANFSGTHDAGGTIGRDEYGIVGEYGPEIVHGPASVTSRKQTAALAEAAMDNISAPQERAQSQQAPSSVMNVSLVTQDGNESERLMRLLRSGQLDDFNREFVMLAKQTGVLQ
jgi:hypothetical protein